MSKIITYKVKPTDSLKDQNRILSSYRSDDYERGTLEVHHVRDVHEVSLRVRSPVIKFEPLPGSRKTWDVYAFPNFVRLVSNVPVPDQDIGAAGFQFNGNDISTGDIELESSNVIRVGLTGQTIDTGSYFLTIQTGLYAENGSKIYGTVWESSATQDVFARDGESVYYNNRGGRIRLERLLVSRHSRSDEVLKRFINTRNGLVNILDYVFLESDSTRTISGWIYLIYEDAASLTIDYIDPPRDSVVGVVGDPVIRIRFSKPLADAVTGDFHERVGLTTHTGINYEGGISSTFHGQNDVVSVTMPSITTGDGVHFIKIDTSNLYANDGDKFLGDSFVHSSYYSRRPQLVRCIDDLCDVDIGTGITTGYVLMYTGGSWRPGPGGGGLTGDISTGDIIDFGSYASQSDFLAHIALSNPHDTYLDDLTDVSASSPEAGHVLAYSEELGSWVNSGLTTGDITDFGSYASSSAFSTLSAAFTQFTGDIDNLTGDFSDHTGDTTIHFTQASIDHGSIGGLGDDDHVQYFLADGSRALSGDLVMTNGSITGAKSVDIVANGDDFVMLSIQTESSQTEDIIHIEDESMGRLLSLSNSGDLQLYLGTGINEFSTDGSMADNSNLAVPTEAAVVEYVSNQVDGLTSFSDPNSHYQSDNTYTGLNTEVGYVVNEVTRRWPGVPYDINLWQGGTTAAYNGGFIKLLTEGSFDIAGYIMTPVPEWYDAPDASNRANVVIDWAGDSDTGAGSVAAFYIGMRVWEPNATPPETPPSLTAAPKYVVVPSGYTGTRVIRSTIPLDNATFPAITNDGNHIFELAIVRYAVDTYVGNMYVYGAQITSGVKYT